MLNPKEAALSDEKYIRSITAGLDLNNPKDIEKVYGELQSGAHFFESDQGRAFDDRIYELHQKVIRGEIVAKEDRKHSSRLKRNKPVAKANESANVLKDRRQEGSQNRNNDAEYQAIVDELAKKQLKKADNRRKLFIVLASLVAAVSLGYFGYYYYMSQKVSDDSEQLADLKGSTALSNSHVLDEKEMFDIHKQSVVLPDILDDYKTLYVKNRELAGWLKIEGTKIDYPVMQTSDNDYYLKHNFDKKSDNNGALFLDCNCSLYPKSTNMIIYGHHMKSGNMFGNLQQFAKEDFYKKHKNISFDTIYEKGTYEIMYVFYSKVYDNDDLVFKYYQFTNANSETEFDYYMDEMSKLSLYDTGVKAQYGDTLLTLSTCDHSQTDGRFAVVAKKVK